MLLRTVAVGGGWGLREFGLALGCLGYAGSGFFGRGGKVVLTELEMGTEMEMEIELEF